MASFTLKLKTKELKNAIEQAFAETVKASHEALQDAIETDSFFPPQGSGDGDIVWTGALRDSQESELESPLTAYFAWGGMQQVIYKGRPITKNVSLYAPIIHMGGSARTFESGRRTQFDARPWTDVLYPESALAKHIGFNILDTFVGAYNNAS